METLEGQEPEALSSSPKSNTNKLWVEKQVILYSLATELGEDTLYESSN